MFRSTPPTLAPTAAARWHRTAAAASPWLHEEVARRMQERLQWLRHAPISWCDWEPVRGGLQGHALVAQRYPQAACWIAESPQHLPAAQGALGKAWWQPGRWRASAPRFEVPAPDSVQLLWSNMALHHEADPLALLQRWHALLAVDGLLMFSCLGPDTLRELRALYQQQGWPAPAHSLTDMHDWGDMLIEAGFAEPVMDMERITLTFATPERLLQELRELGRNLHIQRFAALRGRSWKAQLHQALAASLPREPGTQALSLTFEIIYGHAVKPVPRAPVQSESSVSLQAMRTMLQQGRKS